jgi:hypothetical protein
VTTNTHLSFDVAFLSKLLSTSTQRGAECQNIFPPINVFQSVELNNPVAVELAVAILTVVPCPYHCACSARDRHPRFVVVKLPWPLHPAY